jgi:hypothetical protein
MAAYTPVVGFTVTAYQDTLAGSVLCVHVIPSVDEAAIDELKATVTYNRFVGPVDVV